MLGLKHPILQAIWIACFYFYVSIANATDPTLAKIEYSLSRAKADLNLISAYMGKSIETRQLYLISETSNQAVYFQAKRLYQKILQLNFEITGILDRASDSSPRKKITSDDIYKQIIKITNILEKIKAYLKIKTKKLNHQPQKRNSLPDIFYELVYLNQTTNYLLERETQPSDVYQTLTLAIYYAGEILKNMPGVSPVANEDSMVLNKTPKDVFWRLAYILRKINIVLTQLKINTIHISQIKPKESIRPNDVQELAALIAADLVSICEEKGINYQNIKSYFPGKKYPSDVYQRSSILLKQIEKINHYLKSHPQWLKDENK